MPQAPSVAIPTRLPLVVEAQNRDESTNKDAKLINAYVEKNDRTGEYWVFKRPGLLQTGSTLSGVGRGVYNWQGDIYSIFGSTLYKNGSSVATGLDTTNGVYRFSQCLGATPKLQLGNGTVTYNYDSGSGLVAMAGVNYPSPAVKGIGYLDGKIYLMNSSGEIRGTNGLNDPTDWSDATNTITAQIEPDGGVALAKQLVYILALGQWSTEVFYDAANPAGQSPLGPVQGAKINYGCVNADSVQEIDGTLFWLATNRSAAVQVLMVDNLKPGIISTKPIERLLNDVVDFTSVYSFGLKFEGHRFYGFSLPLANLTLVYDMTDKMWSQWTDSDGNYFPIVSSTYNTTTGRVVQHATNGKLYNLDYNYDTDDGAIITVDIITPNFDGGVRRRKQLNVMEFIADQTPGSVLQVRNNDWDYQASRWTNFRSVDLNQRKPILVNNGTFMRRAYHFRHQCDAPLRIQAVELQMDIGTL